MIRFMFEGIKAATNKYLTMIRKSLILWLAGEQLPVILNCRVYDDILKYNSKLAGDMLTSNCRVEKIEKHIQREALINRANYDKGVIRQGNSFVLMGPSEEDFE